MGAGAAFRLCAGVGNTLAEETAREGEDGRRGGGGGAGPGESGEQQVRAAQGTDGTVAGKVCPEPGERWAAHGEGAARETPRVPELFY